MPELPDDLVARLRAEADRLDAAAPPITPADARGATAPSHNRRWLPVAAALLVFVAIGAAWLLLAGDDGPEQLIVPADPPSTTTTTTAPPLVDSLFDVTMGIAIVSNDGPVRVLDLDGAELGTVPAPVEAINGPELMLTEPPTPVEPIDPAEVPPGCTSAYGGGGVRVALCGGEAHEVQAIDVVDPTGATRRLTGPPFDDSTPVDAQVGHWRWALPSPDGKWVLAQWSGECEVPTAFLTSADGAGVPLLPVGAATTSRGLGWTADGLAIVELRHGACGSTAEVPGVYLVDPDTAELTLVVEVDQGETAYVWRTPDAMSPIGRLLTRAEQELGLEYVLGPDDAPVAYFEGHQIGINGSAEPGPPDPSSQPLDLLHGQAFLSRPGLVEGAAASLSFTCGGIDWRLDWWDAGDPEVDSMLLLAEMLVPHLYCTLPPR